MQRNSCSLTTLTVLLSACGGGTETRSSAGPQNMVGAPLPAPRADLEAPAAAGLRDLGPAQYGTAVFGPCGDLAWRDETGGLRFAGPALAAGVRVDGEFTRWAFSDDGRFLDTFALDHLNRISLRPGGETEHAWSQGDFTGHELQRIGYVTVDEHAQPWICVSTPRGAGVALEGAGALGPQVGTCQDVEPARTHPRVVARRVDGVVVVRDLDAATEGVLENASPEVLAPVVGPDGFRHDSLAWGPGDAAVIVRTHVRDLAGGGDVTTEQPTGAVALFDPRGAELARFGIDATAAVRLGTEPDGGVTDGPGTVRGWATTDGETILLHADARVERIPGVQVVRVSPGADAVLGLNAAGTRLVRWRRGRGTVEVLGPAPDALGAGPALEAVVAVGFDEGPPRRWQVTRHSARGDEALGEFSGETRPLWVGDDGRTLLAHRDDDGRMRATLFGVDGERREVPALDQTDAVTPVAAGLLAAPRRGGLTRLVLFDPVSARAEVLLEGGDLVAVVDPMGLRIAATGYTAHRAYHAGDDRVFAGALRFTDVAP